MRIDEKFDLDKLFFSSDEHFFHDNIIKYCNRPFSNAIEMNEALISNWNNIVPEDGNVFVAGDFIHTGKIETVKNIIDRLNGKIWWILGNHCYQSKHDRKIISDMVDGRQMDVATVLIKNDNDQRLFISHYPHLYWPRDTWHLHGHIHSGPNSTSSEKAPFHVARYDIGCDNNQYKPISYQEVKDIINKQKEL
jgi:calcineurin-like phosphoesterase family protein